MNLGVQISLWQVKLKCYFRDKKRWECQGSLWMILRWLENLRWPAQLDTSEKVSSAPLVFSVRRRVIEEKRSSRVLADLADLRSQSFHPSVWFAVLKFSWAVSAAKAASQHYLSIQMELIMFSWFLNWFSKIVCNFHKGNAFYCVNKIFIC